MLNEQVCSFLSGSFTGAMSGDTGQLGGDTVSGTLAFTTTVPATGGASVAVTLSRQILTPSNRRASQSAGSRD